jgi:hypothetical protein
MSKNVAQRETVTSEAALNQEGGSCFGASSCSSVFERPILFSAQLVQAILRDEKTETRRVIKPQPSPEHWQKIECEWYHPLRVRRNGVEYPADKAYGFASEDEDWRCPYGGPGCNLWVRETFLWDEVGTDVSYRADYDDETAAAIIEGSGDRWRPSIHMPRWAARINLRVREISVERLHEITEEAAKAEEVDAIPEAPAALSHRTSFARLWDKINEKRGYGWDRNPWVWVVKFTVSDER